MTSLTPPADHNSALSPEIFLDFVVEAAKAQRILDEANSELRHVYKRAKRAGVDLKEFKKALAEIKVDPEQRQASQATYARYMAWLGKPVVYQAELAIVEPSQRAKDALSLSIWEQEGYDGALAGREPGDNPYPPGGPAAQAWHVGNTNGTAFKNRLPSIEAKPRAVRKGRSRKTADAAETSGETKH